MALGTDDGVRLTPGVLGGMGPEATLDFFAKLLAASPAERDQDRLRVLIDNNPKVPNRNEAVAGQGPSPAPVLAEMARGLERSGADFLVMPCNAAHAYADAIEAAVAIPFVNIVAETVTETVAAALHQNRRLECVGVLAAAGCIDAGLYQEGFAEHGVRTLIPTGEGRKRFMELLYRIKSGDTSRRSRNEMSSLAHELIAAGAQAVVAGCTEVPLVLDEADIPCPLINSTDVLVRATVDFAVGRRKFAGAFEPSAR